VVQKHCCITDRNVKKNYDRIITRAKYHGSFYISDKIQNAGFGPSYRLVRVSDGKALENLISASRLSLFVCLLLNGTSALFRPLVPRIVDRLYTADQRADFYERYPAMTSQASGRPTDHMNVKTESETVTPSQASTSEENNAAQDLLTVPGFERAIKILKQRQRKKNLNILFYLPTRRKLGRMKYRQLC